MKSVKNLNLITIYGHTPKNTDKNSFISDKNYTVFYDKKTKGIFKAGVKNISTTYFMLIFLTLYLIMIYFPNNIIPYHENSMFFVFFYCHDSKFNIRKYFIKKIKQRFKKNYII